jgi:ubiquinone/menaquinone biosynthesis C-methylase UbiE
MGELVTMLYDPLVAPLDPMGLRKWRQWAVSAAHGHVLELGVGTGLNLPHYAAAESVTAIDPDEASLRRAFSRLNRSRAAISLQQARAEELPFPDGAFDTVVGTLVFCTISDPGRALSEVQRVLKPGGTVRLIEHVRVGNRVIAGAQDAVTPFWSQIAGGCHLNRDTLAEVERAGLHVTMLHRRIGGLFIGINAVRQDRIA